MESKEVKPKPFSGFKDWLIVNEAQKRNRAEVVISNLRNLEDLVAKEYAEGERIGEIHSFYGVLEGANGYKTRERNRIITGIKKKLNRIFKILTSEQKSNDILKNPTIPEINEYKTAYLSYVKFLGEMTGHFTLESLEEEGVITRQRKRNSKVPESERISPQYFKRGIVGLMRNVGLFAEGDYQAILNRLNQMSEIMDAYAKMHGGNIGNVLLPLSLITTTNVHSFPEWQSILANSENIRVNGEKILDENVTSVVIDTTTASLNLLNGANEIKTVELPVISTRRASNRILSVRLYPTVPFSQQIYSLKILRYECNQLRKVTQLYNRVAARITDHEERIELMREFLDFDYYAEAAVHTLMSLKDYASCFNVELVVE